MSNPTPTRHGDWHVVDGQLVDANTAARQAVAAGEAITGDGTGTALPPVVETSTPAVRRNKSKE